MFEAKLIALYSYVAAKYETELQYHCLRFSNNNEPPAFSDVEVITIYLYAVRYEELRQVKAMHRFVRNHLLSWFPKLPSYQAFTNRINRLCSVFGHLAEAIIEDHLPMDADPTMSMTDSFPVITCSHKRKPRVAPGTCRLHLQRYQRHVVQRGKSAHQRHAPPLHHALSLCGAHQQCQ